jgi:hypothetical protein
MRKLLLTTIAASFILILAGGASAAPRYVPGVLMVKFNEVLSNGGKEPLETQYPEINTLNRTYGVYKIEPLYPFLPKEPINDPNGKWKWKHWQEAMEKYRLDKDYVVYYDRRHGPEAVANAYKASGAVDYAVPDCEGHWNYIPTDPDFSYQWHLNNTGSNPPNPPGGSYDADIDAPEAWDNWPISERDAIVAVIDSGVQCYESARYSGPHEDLVENFYYTGEYPWPGKNFRDPEYAPNDYLGHGTAVTGIFGATTGRPLPVEVGVAGVCYNKAKIMPCKVASQYGGPDLAFVNAAIVWAAQNGADVENMSFGWYEEDFPEGVPPEPFCVAVKFAYSLGVVMVAALGNENRDDPSWPAWFKEVIAVSGTDAYDAKWSMSDWGQETEFAAPAAVGIYTTLMYEDLINPEAPKYGYVPGPGGVSFAAPAVSGMAGLVQAWIYWGTDPPSDRSVIVRGKLKDCCDDVNWQQYPGWDVYLGWGRVNLDKLADDLYGGDGDAGAGVPSTARPLTVTAAVAPNPAHNVAKFAISLPAGTPGTDVELTIYDLAGRKIASKAVPCSGEGRLDIDWDCRSSSGAALAPGVYIYRIRAAESNVAGKVVIAE